MFTGIVQGTATVTSIDRPSPGTAQLALTFPPGALAGVPLGGSVAIDGTCLTVVAVEGDVARFDVVDETLRVTTLGALAAGAATNYERSARVGDEIGGHMVSGHVACTATVAAVRRADDGNVSVDLALPSLWRRYVLSKGFVALAGCSLTVGAVTHEGFTVHLIPETLRATVLGSWAPGDRVNVEVDAGTQATVDAVERVLEERLEGVVAARVEAALAARG
jgi:riboflavin synthase